MSKYEKICECGERYWIDSEYFPNRYRPDETFYEYVRYVCKKCGRILGSVREISLLGAYFDNIRIRKIGEVK